MGSQQDPDGVALADRQPLNFLERERPSSVSEAHDDLRLALMRVDLVAESASALLVALTGAQIDREAMCATLGLIREDASRAMEALREAQRFARA